MSHSTQNSSFFGDVLPSQSLGLVLKLLLLLLHPPLQQTTSEVWWLSGG